MMLSHNAYYNLTEWQRKTSLIPYEGPGDRDYRIVRKLGMTLDQAREMQAQAAADLRAMLRELGYTSFLPNDIESLCAILEADDQHRKKGEHAHE